MAQNRIIAYYRVSTDQQGRSGLGLEAQEASIAQYADRSGVELLAAYTEIETGKRDSLDNRPELRKAIAHARRSKATLAVAKLDRLTRSVHVTSMLHQSGVDFVCCDNPFANRLTIQILAAVAEDEARRISERTKAALGAYKARGGMLGASLVQCRNLTPHARCEGTINSARSSRRRAIESYLDIMPVVRQLRGCHTLRQIADHLNATGHTTRHGRQWSATQVGRVLSYDSDANLGT